MMKMGVNKDINYQIERLKNIDSSKFGPIGEKIGIVCDANQGFNYDESIKFIHGCKNIKIKFFEQPIGKQEYNKLKLLNKECIDCGFNLSLDESIQDMNACKYCIDNKIASVFSIKVSKNGGISKLVSISQLCKEKNIECLFNSMIEFGVAQASALSVAAITENIVLDMGHCFMSTLRFKDDISDFKKLISKDKIVKLSDKPGLGINVDEHKLKAFSSKIVICKHGRYSQI